MISSEGGKVLVFDEQEQQKRSMFVDEQTRDPFNWAPSILAKYKKGYSKPVTGRSDQLQLSGILWNSYMPVAVIDGSLVGEGEKLGDSYVVEIEPERVLLQQGSEQIVLVFEELDIYLGNQVSFNNGTNNNAKR